MMRRRTIRSHGRRPSPWRDDINVDVEFFRAAARFSCNLVLFIDMGGVRSGACLAWATSLPEDFSVEALLRCSRKRPLRPHRNLPSAPRPCACSRLRFFPRPELPLSRRPGRNLAGRCLEPNIFFEPEFALPALAHLGARKRLRVIFVWDCTTKPRRLIAVLPFTLPIAWLIGRCRAWVHEQAALGTPLLDRTCPAEALDALLEAIGRRFPRLAILLLPLIPKDGPTFALLQSFAARRKARLTLFGEHARAVLQRPFVDPLSSGAAAELRRQRRRLANPAASPTVADTICRASPTAWNNS